MIDVVEPKSSYDYHALRQARIKARMSQYDLAEQSGVMLPLLRAFELGKVALREEQLTALRAILDQPPRG